MNHATRFAKLALLLAIVGALALGGCGGNDGLSAADQARIEQAEADKLAAEEQAEKDRLAKLAAEEQAEKDRLAKLAAEEQAEKARLTAIQDARQKIGAATTAEAAQAAYDAVKDDVTATEGTGLQAAVDMRIAALMAMDRAATQTMALETAADNVDTSDLTTAEGIAAANTAINELKTALVAAVDVSDADKAMYQATVDAAVTAVMTTQSALDHTAQMVALTDAVTTLRAIDLSGLTTQAKIDAAGAAIAMLRTALEAATELSDAEKSAAMVELATANRTVMMAQGRVDIEGQMMMISGAVDALEVIDLSVLMTQAQIDAAEKAIIELDLALDAATDLTAAQKLDATVDVTLAKRRVMAAKEALASNIEGQTEALTTAGTALGEIDLDDLDAPEKVAAAKEAAGMLKMALAAATHVSDTDKEMYQTQLDAATETVRMAQTGMDLGGRMTAQRTALTNAMMTARTVVGMVNDDATDAQVTAADDAIAALQAAIDGAEDLPEGDTGVATAQGTLTTLTALLANAKTSRMAAMDEQVVEDRKAMAKIGKAMFASLGPPVGTDKTALDNVQGVTLLEAGLKVDAQEGAGAILNANPPPVTLEAGASAGALGSWNGMNYAHTNSGTKVVNEAVVYTNKGPGKTVPFEAKYVFVNLPAEAEDADKSYVKVDSDRPKAVMAAAFTHSGEQKHSIPVKSDAFYTRGTLAGAPGEYRCSKSEKGCSSTNDGKGSPSSLDGDWYFKPDAGVNAMALLPDPDYLYFGWWLSKDEDGRPAAASAFIGVVAADEAAKRALENVSGTDLTGGATYNGHAIGKFAIDNPLDGTGDGGHFTADATLTAKFGGASATGAGITGTIGNFMANDKSVPWSVTLHQAKWGKDNTFATPAADVAATTADETKGTTWSIDGNSAARSGSWSGQMYDEMPGDAPDGDGSTVPTTLTGTFYSKFGPVGRLVGAFGANKQ